MKKVLFALALVAGLLGPALGHARAAAGPTYTSSEPADGARLDEAPDGVSVQFDQPLDPDESALRVFDQCGKKVSGNNLQILVNEMSVDIARKPGGHYEVVYAAVGLKGVTGSTVGKIAFHVTSGAVPKCAGDHTDHKVDHDKHDKKKQHQNHQNDDARHEDMDHETDSGDHDMGSMSDHSGGHGAKDHPKAGGHGGKHGKHADHQGGDKPDGGGEQDQETTLAAPDDLAGNLVADGGTVLLALSLSVGFGILGGWLLRVSGLS